MHAFNRHILINLTDHMYWANGQILTALQAVPLPEAIHRFAHILTTEQIYFERISGHDPWPQHFWPELSLEACIPLIATNAEKYQTFLKTHTVDMLEQAVSYRNSRGTTFRTPIHEMILHLGLHGQHHRGQIAMGLRRAGARPPVVDYITYTRVRPSSGPE